MPRIRRNGSVEKGSWFSDIPMGTEFLIVNDKDPVPKRNWHRLLRCEENTKTLQRLNIIKKVRDLYIPRDAFRIKSGWLDSDNKSNVIGHSAPLKSISGDNNIFIGHEAVVNTRDLIIRACDSIKKVLLEKNKRYGDSALKPRKIFSKLESDEGIKIRLDDKLGRIINSGELRKNDVADLIGYLTLYSVSQGWEDFTDQID